MILILNNIVHLKSMRMSYAKWGGGERANDEPLYRSPK